MNNKFLIYGTMIAMTVSAAAVNLMDAVPASWVPWVKALGGLAAAVAMLFHQYQANGIAAVEAGLVASAPSVLSAVGSAIAEKK